MPATDTVIGLTGAEAAERLRREGPNRLPTGTTVSWEQRLARQLFHFFALMLWVAAVLAVVAGLPQLGIAIVAVVVLNAVFAFVQERRADHAAEGLRDLLPRRALVVRDGASIEIDAADLVVGDLVLLGSGDRISADLEIVEAHTARVDTSTLTGESRPSSLEDVDRAFAGTFLTEGEARGVVYATGERTRLAEIARLASGPSPSPPLVGEIQRVVRTISTVAITVGVAFFVISLVLGSEPSDGFLLAVGVTVALVPEALLPTVTLSLAIGAQRMADRSALVRRLESVETLGSATFVCTDKTGTLTLNELTAVEIWTPLGSTQIEGSGYDPAGRISPEDPDVAAAVRRLARVAVRCSTGRIVQRGDRWVALGDPLDAAVDTLARRVGLDPDADREAHPDVRRFPFDPRRRRMSVVVDREVFVKGASDGLLALCASDAAVEGVQSDMAERGLRVIAVATRSIGKAEHPAAIERDAAERDLELLGLIGLLDPPRAHVAASIDACRRAGVKVAMVTGDHPRTAGSIARQTGLARGEVTVIEGAHLPADDAELGEMVDRDGIVLARIEPEQKLRIARALRARDHVVAMTGDGVNDAPALREADIGVAMGRSGTDVAREAADLVLLDDDFATIVAAIEYGRGIYANVRRFLTYHLTDNVSEVTPFIVWALSGGSIPLALGVLQILALDIGTDTLSATALGAERPGERVMNRPPDRNRLLDREVARRAFGVLGPAEALFTMLAFFVSFLAAGWRPGEPFPGGHVLLQASGAAFATVVSAQTVNAWACRSATRWPGALGWFSNRLLVWGASAELVIAGAFLFVPGLASLLEQAVPSAAGWVVAVAAAPGLLGVDAAYKAYRRRRRPG
ncbi:MAG TPA: cation-transporting P-type ATPase [Actinomycetota bacterium]|nr:cation-transporting P-type ATPase [Actinomycetota bacterium]